MTIASYATRKLKTRLKLPPSLVYSNDIIIESARRRRKKTLKTALKLTIFFVKYPFKWVICKGPPFKCPFAENRK